MIKNIVIFTLLSLPISIYCGAPKASFKPHNTVYKHIIKNKPDLDPTYAEKLAIAVYRASSKYHLNPIKVSAILRQECRYKLQCINNTTKDYGIGQINIRTIKAFKFDQNKLLNDLDYSVEAAVIVLADFKRMYGHKEEDYWTRYNTSKPSKRKEYQRLVVQYL